MPLKLTPSSTAASAVAIYDNGCNFSHYCLNREPQFFRDTFTLVDAAHFIASHQSCSPAFYSRKYPHITDNSQLQEQKNSQIDNIRDQVKHGGVIAYGLGGGGGGGGM